MQIMISKPRSGLSLRFEKDSVQRIRQTLFGAELTAADLTVWVALESIQKTEEGGYDVLLRFLRRDQRSETNAPIAQFSFEETSSQRPWSAHWLTSATPMCPMPCFGPIQSVAEMDGAACFLHVPSEENLPRPLDKRTRATDRTIRPLPQLVAKVPTARVTLSFTDRKHEFELPASEVMDLAIVWAERGLKVQS